MAKNNANSVKDRNYGNELLQTAYCLKYLFRFHTCKWIRPIQIMLFITRVVWLLMEVTVISFR